MLKIEQLYEIKKFQPSKGWTTFFLWSTILKPPKHSLLNVENIDDVVMRLLTHGAKLVGDVVQYEDAYRLAYVRSSEGFMIGLAEELGNK